MDDQGQVNEMRWWFSIDRNGKFITSDTYKSEATTPMAQTTLTDDEIVRLCESWAESSRLKIYKHLNRSGVTMTGIDYAIREAEKKEKAANA